MNLLLEYFWQQRADLLARIGEHLLLVVLSTSLAAAAGIPVGILAARHPRAGRLLIALANLGQTIPSLALLGFLIPLPLVGGIGTRTALVALTVYAVLPIARTTLAGIQGIDAAVRESALAMGMTRRQLLAMIELPLALPSIVAGLRVAAVAGVGTATIASAVGAGGLGDYIFRGLAMVDPVVILAGAIPAALLALAVDAALASVALLTDARARRRHGRAKPLASLAAVGAVALGTLLLGRPVNEPSGARVVVGSKNFSEQVTLGEIVALLLERSGEVTVERRLNLGGTLVCDAALRRGDIDLYVEYAGTALTAVFDEQPSTDRARVGTLVRDRYAALGLTVGPPLGFNSTFAIIVRAEAARAHQLRAISDLKRVMRDWRAGFGFEFLERGDGYPGLARTYGLQFREPPRVMDLNLIYRALASGQVDVIAGDATSGLIDALDLATLVDDRSYFPPYDAIPVVRADALARVPALGRVLTALAGRITEADMRRMNAAVDGDRRDYRDVAREFVDRLR